MTPKSMEVVILAKPESQYFAGCPIHRGFIAMGGRTALLRR